MEDKTIEEYCRLIKKLDLGKGVKSVDVSKRLGLSKNTVAQTLQKLAKQGYIKMKRYGCINLTQKGIGIAKKMNFRHRVIETFLYKKLKMDNRRIHVEACNLEHTASDDMINRLYQFLGKPKLDPHNKRIKG